MFATLDNKGDFTLLESAFEKFGIKNIDEIEIFGDGSIRVKKIDGTDAVGSIKIIDAITISVSWFEGKICQ